MAARWKSNQSGQVKAAWRAAAGVALLEGAEHLGEEANRTVPIEEGTLARSGTSSVDRGALRSAWSYDTPYARRQHEDTRLRHDEGRRAKWLQLTMQERAASIRTLLAESMRRGLS